jgi:ribosomal-protein-alanine N-acetyltransferase
MTSLADIQTPRLLLRAITPALIHNFLEAQTPEEVMQFFGTDVHGYAHLKAMHEKGMETHRMSLHYFLLIDRESKRVSGECGFHTWNKTHRRAELFYTLKNDADKRKGMMTEALPVILDYGFNVLELHRVEALTAAWNTPSLKLLARHGFQKEGTRREDYRLDGQQVNSECYALLKWEWEAYIDAFDHG